MKKLLTYSGAPIIKTSCFISKKESIQMAAQDQKIKLYPYNDRYVSGQVKCLALCFNIAAEHCTLGTDQKQKAANIVTSAVTLYKAVASNTLPDLGVDESRFMRATFLQIASKIAVGDRIGWMSLEDTIAPRLADIEREAGEVGIKFNFQYGPG